MAQHFLSSKLAFIFVTLTSALWLGCGDDDPAVTNDSGTQGDGSTTNPDGSTTTNPDGSTTTNPDGSTTTNPDGSTTTNPDGSTTTNPDGSTTTNPDGSTTNPDAATNDGGFIGTMCQDTVCGGDTPQCCITLQGGSCIGANDDCGGVTATCDGREDCQADEVCCGSLQSGASCTNSCDAQELCNDASDCDSPDQCCRFGGFGICLRNCRP